jgi:hypothetical protein
MSNAMLAMWRVFVAVVRDRHSIGTTPTTQLNSTTLEEHAKWLA